MQFPQTLELKGGLITYCTEYNKEQGLCCNFLKSGTQNEFSVCQESPSHVWILGQWICGPICTWPTEGPEHKGRPDVPFQIISLDLCSDGPPGPHSPERETSPKRPEI